MAKQQDGKSAITLELTPKGMIFLQFYMTAVERGQISPQGGPDMLQQWLDGYREVKVQLLAKEQQDEA